MPVLPSKLPNAGTTIFTVMSALAAEHGAVNLGQGFPDFGADPALLQAVTDAMAAGHNQYPPMTGVPALRQAVAAKLNALYGSAYDADRDITITAGGTQALFTALQCCVGTGDEVIIIEPAYDSYDPAIRLAGAVPVGVPMTADYRLDWTAVRAAVTPRTRALVLNTPHNPSGRVATEDDLRELERIAEQHDLFVISDEVYEHMVFDGERHQSVARHPGLAARSFLVGSFGKTFHVTGWKVGYVAAPAALSAAFRRLHQYTVFTVHTPTQHALAAYLAHPAPWQGLGDFYQAKRDGFRAALAGTKLRLLPCDGTYFQTVDYGAISDLPELDFAKWLTTEIGVAAIPLSVFYQRPQERRHVRFCFAKRDDTLAEAARRLRRGLAG
ncbi:methionine aminotransferase [Roseateles saccharophilus]|uniref:2-keto-4-methylthiobutyrate aminotransferase n=1 Tax=Roseateles saccharophilus TaxID=304 RepID=A0A4R3UJ16_ROSSA|nr:methionine aminotransferase [Roseateles saccharophilus]MDG0834744.1 aminotransferase class I/II-fold pyridoxal phosphate-dependent enzyme [Roseateles saccharophilus]TCU89004.1 2-keto-4-methylthiobutyrate aminotransferase [Roseateles saccharophilus]